MTREGTKAQQSECISRKVLAETFRKRMGKETMKRMMEVQSEELGKIFYIKIPDNQPNF